MKRIKSISKVTYDNPIKVYDVINATPYNNFLIKTNSGYIVSHNCGMIDEISFAPGANVQMEKSKIMETYNGCFSGDTLLLTENGLMRMKDISGNKVRVYTEDDNGNILLTDKVLVKKTRDVTDTVEIELENGSVIKCTSNHEIRLTNGEYKEAKDITIEDDIESINEKEIYKNIDYWKQFGDINELYVRKYIKFISDIENLGNRNLEYKERHHVIPKSFIDNNYLVFLTPREHYIAHKILSKCFTGDRNEELRKISIGRKHITKEE